MSGAFLNLLVSVALPGLVVAGTGAGGDGDCLEGWVDGRSVGLGCLLADQATQQFNYNEAQAACQSYGETGRLIEITNQEQMSFIQSYLAEVEAEWGEPEDGPGFRQSTVIHSDWLKILRLRYLCIKCVVMLSV